MSQIGRRVTDAMDGILNDKRYLIHDRDPLFTEEFQCILASVGVTAMKLPPRSPNLNAYAEGVCAFDQGAVSGPADLIRRKVVAHSGS
jgi:hypothetical protein